MSRVLIVDDNDTMREGMEEVVASMGHEAQTARSGAQALARFKERRPDFVVTDLKMAGMDGVELLRQLRNLDPDVPVLLITAHGTIEVAEQGHRRA